MSEMRFTERKQYFLLELQSRASRVGLPQIIKELREIEKTDPQRWRPSGRWRRLT